MVSFLRRSPLCGFDWLKFRRDLVACRRYQVRMRRGGDEDDDSTPSHHLSPCRTPP